MIRQFVFKGKGDCNLLISESNEPDTFWMTLDGDSVATLTKEDARDISRLLASSYGQYGESVRFQEKDPELE